MRFFPVNREVVLARADIRWKWCLSAAIASVDLLLMVTVTLARCHAPVYLCHALLVAPVEDARSDHLGDTLGQSLVDVIRAHCPRDADLLESDQNEPGNRSWRSSMICVAVTYVIKPGHEDEAVGLIAKLTERTRAEPGCRMYLAHRSTTDPRRFFLYEQYDDQRALDAHRAAPHFEQFAKLGLFPIIESRSPEIYAPLGD
jgi:quinol monooxygenase YgiN